MIDFRICDTNGCKALIEDLTDVIDGYNYNDESYYPSDNENMGYRLNDCVAMYVLTRVRSEGDRTVSVHVVDDPRSDIDVHFEHDGFHKVTKIVIPTNNILANETFMDDDVWPKYGRTRYFYYPTDERYYKIVKKPDTSLLIRGKLLYFDDRKDNCWKEPIPGQRPRYLMVDVDDTKQAVIENAGGERTTDDDGNDIYLTECRLGYRVWTSSDTNKYALYNLASLKEEWVMRNICPIWDEPEGPRIPQSFPTAPDGYVYVPADVEEIIEQCDGAITTIRETKEMFCVCHLRECAFLRNGEYIKDCPNRCVAPEEEDTIKTILWLNATLQVIDFLVDRGDYMGAEQVLEQMQTCGGPCVEIEKRKGGCGCGKA